MRKGVAAIITVIVLGALVVLIGGVMVLTSITEGQSTLMETKVKTNQGVLDACTEESLLRINVNGVVPTTIVTPLGNCSVTVNSQVGSSWDISLKGISGETMATGVNVVLNRGSTIAVSTWVDQ